MPAIVQGSVSGSKGSTTADANLAGRTAIQEAASATSRSGHGSLLPTASTSATAAASGTSIPVAPVTFAVLAAVVVLIAAIFACRKYASSWKAGYTASTDAADAKLARVRGTSADRISESRRGGRSSLGSRAQDEDLESENEAGSDVENAEAEPLRGSAQRSVK